MDHGGHSGDWDEYIAAIESADAIVGELWDWLGNDPVYAGRTTMIVTNDHGRHTDDFQGHGDGCAGCRAIQLLAIGPGIKVGHVSNVERTILDIAPTIGALLGMHTEYTSGEVMTEILVVEQDVPTVSEWGLVGMSLLLFAAAAVMLHFRRTTRRLESAGHCNRGSR